MLLVDATDAEEKSQFTKAAAGPGLPGWACCAASSPWKAVPVLAVAVVATGTGFADSAMYATTEMRFSLVSPGSAYYVLTAARIVLALGLIVATFPLLERIIGPEVARNE